MKILCHLFPRHTEPPCITKCVGVVVFDGMKGYWFELMVLIINLISNQASSWCHYPSTPLWSCSLCYWGTSFPYSSGRSGSTRSSRYYDLSPHDWRTLYCYSAFSRYRFSYTRTQSTRSWSLYSTPPSFGLPSAFIWRWCRWWGLAWLGSTWS